MKYIVIGLVVIIVLLVIYLSRRGATGLGDHSSTDSEGWGMGRYHGPRE